MHRESFEVLRETVGTKILFKFHLYEHNSKAISSARIASVTYSRSSGNESFKLTKRTIGFSSSGVFNYIMEVLDTGTVALYFTF